MNQSQRPAAALLTVTFAVSNCAMADGDGQTFRDLDLNAYALGANVYVSSSPYDGIDDFVTVFPAPMTFGNPIEADETFFIRDGHFGLRKQLASQWDVGGVFSIQTLGFGSGQSPALLGMERRDWTLQGGAIVGRDFGNFRADIFVEADLLGEHGGQEYTLKLARVFDHGSYYFMPQIDITYESSKLVDHYFGVSAAEALPGRPEYHADGATTYGVSLDWSWKWHRHWFVTASAGIDLLPSEIRSSPIVNKDYTWSASVGVAYDAPSMMEMGPPRPKTGAGLEFKVGPYFVNASSTVFLTNGVAAAPISLESDFSLENAEVAVPVDIVWRINEFHSLKFGYFELKRSGARDIIVPIDVGDVSFPAGEIVDTSFDTRVFKLGYAFSLLHDAQKELSIFGGAHISETSFRSTGTNDKTMADTTAILPVLGAGLKVNVKERTSVGAELQLFLSDINRYSGRLVDFSVFGQYSWRRRLTLGAGIRFYRQDIDVADESFFGNYRFQYRGPFVFIGSMF